MLSSTEKTKQANLATVSPTTADNDDNANKIVTSSKKVDQISGSDGGGGGEEGEGKGKGKRAPKNLSDTNNYAGDSKIKSI